MKIHEPRFIDSNGAIPLSNEMTWWVCRRCHVVKMYTKNELLKLRGETPICTEGHGHETNGEWSQAYFMQRIEF